MFVTVGKVIEPESNVPSMHPIMTNPFIFDIVALTTTLFNPESGSEIEKVGVVKNCISYDCICIVSGKSMKLSVDVIIDVDVELRERAERISELVLSIGIE